MQSSHLGRNQQVAAQGNRLALAVYLSQDEIELGEAGRVSPLG